MHRRHPLESKALNWFYLAMAILAEIGATSALKSTEGFSKLVPSALTVIGYGAAFFFLSLTLRTIPMGIAYAIWSGVGIVLISAVGWLAYDQKLDAPAVAGISLIICGVIVLNVFSKATAH
ncbi:multidrug transporter [Methylorubrum populi]|nr:multidrug transporter [Methylorubrum populi]